MRALVLLVLLAVFMVPQISADEFHHLISETDAGSIFLLDVREREEFSLTHIEGSVLVPMMDMEERMDKISEEITNSEKTVVICRCGLRSAMVTRYLQESGFENVYNLDGGINAYSLYDQSVIAY